MDIRRDGSHIFISGPGAPSGISSLSSSSVFVRVFTPPFSEPELAKPVQSPHCNVDACWLNAEEDDIPDSQTSNINLAVIPMPCITVQPFLTQVKLDFPYPTLCTLVTDNDIFLKTIPAPGFCGVLQEQQKNVRSPVLSNPLY